MRRLWVGVFLLLVLAGTALAQTSAHPRVCLVLSGGGARGIAHIGVPKALEAQHIPIDCIAGTIMGAIIGGLYAALDALGLPCPDLACPHCRRKLPPGFLDVPHHIFSMVGAPSAGKS